MCFNEMSHAFIAGKYYSYLKQFYGDKGIQAFIHGTEYYAGQRGRRMAQRAIRDGKTLDYGTYIEYGEWISSDELIALGCANQSEVLSVNPDYKLKINVCPWYAQFKDMGATEAGKEYCKVLDRAICRGFNPELEYSVECTLHDTDHCLHIIKNTYFQENEIHLKKMEYVKDFDFHCAHSFWAYKEVIDAIFLDNGKISDLVLNDFKKEYGKEKAEQLLKYENVNFNISD